MQQHTDTPTPSSSAVPSGPALGSVVAQGWILMFLVLICIFLTEFATSVIAGNLGFFQSREGDKALKAMVMLMMLHAFVPMLVCAISAAWFRWLVVVITGVLTILMMGHEIVHLLTGTKPFGVFHLLDFSHHGLGIWVTFTAVRWARQAQAAAGQPRPTVLAASTS